MTIPNSVLFIGDTAFTGRRWPETLILPGVIDIGFRAFYGCEYLKSVSMPVIVGIGEGAFYNCVRLASVTFSSVLATIREGAFRSCRVDFTSLPDSIAEIGGDAFSYCDRLVSVTLTCPIPFVERYTFHECGALESISLPDTVTAIRDNAFYYTGLTTIQLPPFLSQLGREALLLCPLIDIRLPDSVQRVSYDVFPSTLQKISMPGAIFGMVPDAFSYCDDLQEVQLRGFPCQTVCRALSGFSLAKFTISGLGSVAPPTTACDRVYEVASDEPSDDQASRSPRAPRTPTPTILRLPTRPPDDSTARHTPARTPPTTTAPSSIWCELAQYELIGSTLTISVPGTEEGYYRTRVERSCVNTFRVDHEDGNWFEPLVKSVQIGEGVIAIGAWAFADQRINFVSLSYTLRTMAMGAFAYQNDLTAVTFPRTLESIGTWAFAWSGLQSVHIPASVSLISNEAFAGCPVSDFTVASGNPTYIADDGIIYFTNMTTLIAYPAGNPRIAFSVPYMTRVIGAYAFQETYNLESVDLARISSIEERGFDSAHSIKHFVFPATLQHVGFRALANMTALESVQLPDSVLTIGDECFYACDSLSWVSLPNSARHCPDGLVFGCLSLTDVFLGNSMKSIGVGPFDRAPKLIDIFVPDSVDTLEPGALRNSDLQSISLPSTITSISSDEFEVPFHPTQIHIRGAPAVASTLCYMLGRIADREPDFWWNPIFIHVSGVPGSVICSNRGIIVEKGPAPRLTNRPSATNLATQIRPATHSPTSSRGRLPAGGSGTPARFDLTGNTPIDIAALDSARRVTLCGKGVLRGVSDELWLGEVTLERGSQLTAYGLVVQHSLRLEPNTKLAPGAHEKIELFNDVTIVFDFGKIEGLSTLDLGEIGANYTIVPRSIQIVLTQTGGDSAVHEVLIRGKALSNCAEWLDRVEGLPKRYSVTCERVRETRQLAAADLPEMGLFLVRPEGPDDVDDEPFTFGEVWEIVIVAALCVIPVAILVAVICWCRRRKRANESGEPGEVSA
jgi:hypothetical protein